MKIYAWQGETWVSAETRAEVTAMARERWGYNCQIDSWPPECAVKEMWVSKWAEIKARCEALLIHEHATDEIRKTARFSLTLAERNLKGNPSQAGEENYRQCLNHLRVAEANCRPFRGWLGDNDE